MLQVRLSRCCICFHTYVANVLSGCCICLQWFSSFLDVFASVSDVCYKCFNYFEHILEVLHLDVVNWIECCSCCNWTHLLQPPAETAGASPSGRRGPSRGSGGGASSPRMGSHGVGSRVGHLKRIAGVGIHPGISTTDYFCIELLLLSADGTI
jgi:hypothetical protein